MKIYLGILLITFLNATNALAGNPAVDKLCSDLAARAIRLQPDSITTFSWSGSDGIMTDSALNQNADNFELLLTCVTQAFGKPLQLTKGVDPRFRQAQWQTKGGVAVLFLDHERLVFNVWKVPIRDPKTPSKLKMILSDG